MTFPTLVTKVSNLTGLKECSWYNVQNLPGNGEIAVPFADFVPAEFAGQMHITHSFIKDSAAFTDAATSGSTLVVESPAGSSKWEISLGWAMGGVAFVKDAFNPGVIMSPGDELCLQYWGVNRNMSYGIKFTLVPPP